MATTVVKSPTVIHIPIPGVNHIPIPTPGDVIHAGEGVVSAGQETAKLAEAVLSKNFWIRVAEGTVGLVLIAIGINKLFSLNVGGKVASLA